MVTGPRCTLSAGAWVRTGAQLGAGVRCDDSSDVVERARLGEHVRLGPGARVGARADVQNRAEIRDHREVAAGEWIAAGTRLGAREWTIERTAADERGR